MSFKIVFMGTPEFSVPALDVLIKNKFDILSVYTQPPTKSNRGQKINTSPIEEFSKKNKLNFRNPVNLNSGIIFKFTQFSINEYNSKLYRRYLPNRSWRFCCFSK